VWGYQLVFYSSLMQINMGLISSAIKQGMSLSLTLSKVNDFFVKQGLVLTTNTEHPHEIT
jgi:hypothetical protein